MTSTLVEPNATLRGATTGFSAYQRAEWSNGPKLKITSKASPVAAGARQTGPERAARCRRRPGRVAQMQQRTERDRRQSQGNYRCMDTQHAECSAAMCSQSGVASGCAP
ncbi:hypothetical protein FQJ88_05115 [Xanthomonas vasicola]|uniref:Uncharacterized protein n=1 Tax=Xanthomonas vasicola TaxID=56459 RepID=A0ABD7SBU2_XANVA|nr:hypothetical protein [Xanthomonas vasicola]AZR21394.1 hypothetical protein NX81_002295 [Xanthomonas vasicola]MDO6984547.1 hypothetical protein [Xanthomonas vasicola]TWQ26734.1 hypothetical protein FQJ97_02345 [Xanthomonas vasicola]TWQ41072.1 hypothetical protein FQJ96_04695 [Xanthomonas vasicola]TWQ53333.1 hypothetical protein FQJ94_14695 [Xanthomonas vasicola]